MLRKIIRIDEEKCNGCGACARGLPRGGHRHGERQGAAAARGLLRRPGRLPARLPHRRPSPLRCAKPPAYDAGRRQRPNGKGRRAPRGCPGSRPAAFAREAASGGKPSGNVPSQLSQWPVQIKLAPGQRARSFHGADLLIAADCTAYAYGNFHADFIRGRVTLVGCPKLDAGDYAEKLAQIFSAQRYHSSITVARMEVPCCGGLESAVRRALEMSGKDIPLAVSTIAINGELLESGR